MTTAAKILIGLLLGALLLGCAMPEDRETIPLDVALPAAWTAAPTTQGAARKDWWNGFGDPALDGLVREALAHNKDLRQAAARIDQAEVAARIAGAELLPRLGLGLGGARGQSTVLDQAVVGNDLNVTFRIGWELDLWGRLRAGQLAAIKDTEVARAHYAGARLSLVARTVKARFAAEEMRRQLQLARTTVDNHQRALDIVRDRFRRGVCPAVDVRMATANLASARALLGARLQHLDHAVRSLEVLLGRYPSRELTAEAPLPTLPGPPPAGLPSDLLKRRPDLVAARFRVIASDARVFGARAALLPRVSLTAAGGTASGELGDLFKGSSLVWQFAGNLLQPLFEGGKLCANVELQKSRVAEALAAFETTALEAFREVETALAAEQILAEREGHLEEAVRHATEARHQAERRYQMGLESILMVLETQRRELDARSRLLSVHRTRLDNRVNLHLALGGSF